MPCHMPGKRVAFSLLNILAPTRFLELIIIPESSVEPRLHAHPCTQSVRLTRCVHGYAGPHDTENAEGRSEQPRIVLPKTCAHWICPWEMPAF